MTQLIVFLLAIHSYLKQSCIKPHMFFYSAINVLLIRDKRPHDDQRNVYKYFWNQNAKSITSGAQIIRLGPILFYDLHFEETIS